MSDERIAGYVREALGSPDLDVEIESVQQWNACADWAERFREDEVAPVTLTLADNPVSRTLQDLEGSDRTSPIEPLDPLP